MLGQGISGEPEQEAVSVAATCEALAETVGVVGHDDIPVVVIALGVVARCLLSIVRAAPDRSLRSFLAGRWI